MSETMKYRSKEGKRDAGTMRGQGCITHSLKHMRLTPVRTPGITERLQCSGMIDEVAAHCGERFGADDVRRRHVLRRPCSR